MTSESMQPLPEMGRSTTVLAVHVLAMRYLFLAIAGVAAFDVLICLVLAMLDRSVRAKLLHGACALIGVVLAVASWFMVRSLPARDEDVELRQFAALAVFLAAEWLLIHGIQAMDREAEAAG